MMVASMAGSWLCLARSPMGMSATEVGSRVAVRGIIAIGRSRVLSGRGYRRVVSLVAPACAFSSAVRPSARNIHRRLHCARLPGGPVTSSLLYLHAQTIDCIITGFYSTCCICSYFSSKTGLAASNASSTKASCPDSDPKDNS